MDRFDLRLEVPSLAVADLALPPSGDSSATVAARVAAARARQAARYARAGRPEVRINAAADGDLLDAVAKPDSEGLELLDRAAEKLRLTARGYRRAMRLARTIADLEGAERVGRAHVAEAVSYRRAPLVR
jgi:magnesium chelatase family protein